MEVCKYIRKERKRDEIRKAIEILQRKTSIPEDDEDFSDISSAFDLGVKALNFLEELLDYLDNNAVPLMCAIGTEIEVFEKKDLVDFVKDIFVFEVK
jgi:hypothetical protein